MFIIVHLYLLTHPKVASSCLTAKGVSLQGIAACLPCPDRVSTLKECEGCCAAFAIILRRPQKTLVNLITVVPLLDLQLLKWWPNKD